MALLMTVFFENGFSENYFPNVDNRNFPIAIRPYVSGLKCRSLGRTMETAKIPTVFPDLKGRSGGKCGSKRWYRDRGNGDQNRPVLFC